MSDTWTQCSSRAVEAYRYLPGSGVLQILFRDGRQVYDYPCDAAMFDAFLAAASKGRFVNRVLAPHARRVGVSPRPRPWRG